VSLDNWIETYSNHTAWETIESTIEQVGELNGDDEDEQQTLEYIRLTLRAVLELQSAPTLLVSPLILSNLDISVRSNVKAQLDQWAANSNVAHLNNAYTNLHIVLDVVRGWPSSKEQNLRAAAATLRESVKSSHTHLQSLQQAVEETKTILENERDSIHQQLDQREDVSIGRFQELEQSLIQAAQRQDQIEARLDSIVATHQDTFTKAEAGRLAEHQQALKDRRAEFAESLDKAVQESQETLESQQASGENVLARLGELED